MFAVRRYLGGDIQPAVATANGEDFFPGVVAGVAEEFGMGECGGVDGVPLCQAGDGGDEGGGEVAGGDEEGVVGVLSSVGGVQVLACERPGCVVGVGLGVGGFLLDVADLGGEMD